ncbi:unnamed protein product [Penicillium glandicola]
MSPVGILVGTSKILASTSMARGHAETKRRWSWIIGDIVYIYASVRPEQVSQLGLVAMDGSVGAICTVKFTHRQPHLTALLPPPDRSPSFTSPTDLHAETQPTADHSFPSMEGAKASKPTKGTQRPATNS